MRPCDWCGDAAIVEVNGKTACNLHVDNAMVEAVAPIAAIFKETKT